MRDITREIIAPNFDEIIEKASDQHCDNQTILLLILIFNKSLVFVDKSNMICSRRMMMDIELN